MVQVRDEHEYPVRGAKVDVRGLERDALGAEIDQENEKPDVVKKKFPGWHFVTDSQGKFTARFGNFRQYDYQEATGMEVPAWGSFYFVVEADGLGGVSAEILNPQPDELEQIEARLKVNDNGDVGEASEWTKNPVLLKDGKNSTEFALETGLEVEGRVLDTAGKPVPGLHIEIFHDLHAGSHTGRGGEIFSKSMDTDAKGRFWFEHVYPNTFYFDPTFGEDGRFNWVRTRVRERWANEILDEIRLHESETETHIPMVIVVSTKPIYHYFGKVTDQHGKPVAGAEVDAHYSLHRVSRTFEDGRYHQAAKTGRDGSYDLWLPAQFVEFWDVKAKDCTFDMREADYDELDEPGEYDLTVKRPH